MSVFLTSEGFMVGSSNFGSDFLSTYWKEPELSLFLVEGACILWYMEESKSNSLVENV
jgi:hypothetical protein